MKSLDYANSIDISNGNTITLQKDGILKVHFSQSHQSGTPILYINGKSFSSKFTDPGITNQTWGVLEISDDFPVAKGTIIKLTSASSIQGYIKFIPYNKS